MQTLGETLRQIRDYGPAVELQGPGPKGAGRISAAGLLAALADTGELERPASLVWEREAQGEPAATAATASRVLGRVYLFTASGKADAAPAFYIMATPRA